MPEILRAFTNLRLEPEHRERMQRIFAPAPLEVIAVQDTRARTTALESADVAVVGDGVDGGMLAAPRLRWVHVDRAGLERSARPEVLASGLMVTGSAGRSAPAIAEHALLFMLALSYRMPDFLDAQRRRHWGIRHQRELRGLFGRCVGILGTGNNGTALAVRAAALGMRVVGYRRRRAPPPPGFDRVFCGDAGEPLALLLGDSDFVVVTLPLNDRTHRLLGERELAQMRPGACLINVGRGAVVDEQALVASLRHGRLGGAGLDTFASEPLPRSSALWKMDSVMITPHVTPQVADRMSRSLDIVAENVRRYRDGQPLLNQLGPGDCYSGPVPSVRAVRRWHRRWRRIARPWRR